MRSSTLQRFSAFFSFAFLALTALPQALAVEAPQLVQKDGRYALLVEGQPFLILGGQIHNSSGWPSELPQVWQSMAALHANTIEAPVYWEQLEPQPGHFDFTNVDQIVQGARAHNLHVVLCWFGTWKNGNMHYVPDWVKTDTKRFPRTIRPDGEPIDVLSPMARTSLEADKAAFVALTRHLKQTDNEQHTVLLIQVENESGNIGSVRDNSPESNREFAGQVPADLLAAAHKQAGTWSQVLGAEADEIFQAYHQAKYINEIAAAGKQEFAIPFYINVWIDYPAAALSQRQLDMPGLAYPSGGAVQKLVGLWRKLAPSIDMVGPDLYADDSLFYRETMKAYDRPDNPKPAGQTALESSSSMRWARARSAFRPSAWTRQGGTSSATNRGPRTQTTSRSSRPWIVKSRAWNLKASSRLPWKSRGRRRKKSTLAAGR
jgi:beta-galactosidase GanA